MRVLLALRKRGAQEVAAGAVGKLEPPVSPELVGVAVNRLAPT
jgi:hypothetical protein